MAIKFTGKFPGIHCQITRSAIKVVWQSSPTISVTENAAITTHLLATGDQPVTYTLHSGSLPSGVTLNSNGSFSGTAAYAAAASYTFVVRASSPYTFADQTITMTTIAPPAGLAQLIANGAGTTSTGWTGTNSTGTSTSLVSFNRGALRISSGTTMFQTTTKADIGKTYTFKMSYQNAQSAGSAVSLPWNIKAGTSILASGTINAVGSISAINTIGTFVGTEAPITLNVTDSTGADVLLYNISITRNGG